MAHPTPSFSSFPDLEAPTTNHASSSKQPIPSFGSFPTDVAQPGTKDRPRDRSDDPRDRESTRRRTGDESSRRRRRSRSDDEREERRRERKREERRARDRNRERDDEERARKEDRRRRERDKAEKLRRDEHERMDRKEMERRTDKLDARPELYEVDDGGAWYESVTKARPRVGYQEPYDPVSRRGEARYVADCSWPHRRATRTRLEIERPRSITRLRHIAHLNTTGMEVSPP